ncbi:unnamed protein product, partial [Amoebophrya sp. A120]
EQRIVRDGSEGREGRSTSGTHETTRDEKRSFDLLKGRVLPQGLGVCFLPGVEDGSLLDPRKDHWLPIAKDLQPTFDLCCQRTQHLSVEEVTELYGLLNHNQEHHQKNRKPEPPEEETLERPRSTSTDSIDSYTTSTTAAKTDDDDENSTLSSRSHPVLGRLFFEVEPSSTWDDDASSLWPPEYEQRKHVPI